MRLPSIYAKKQLTDLLLNANFFPQAYLPGVLAQIGQAAFAYTLDLSGSPLQAMTNAIDALAKAGMLDGVFLDALEQHPLLQQLGAALRQIRIDMEIIPNPKELVSAAEIERLVEAARRGQLHTGLGFVRLQNEMPLEVRRRASSAVLDQAEQLKAWFDAANRQIVGPGDAVWMVGLLEKAIQHAAPPGKAGLQQGLERLRLALGVDPRDAPLEAGGLEQLVQAYGIVVDASTFVTRMAEALGRVCLVRIGDDDIGTGFLVGDDLVLTNHHVLSRVINGSRDAAQVSFVFDYRSEEGVAREGPRFGLLLAGATPEDPRPWLIDASPPTDQELDALGPGPDIAQATDPAYLDFALVRLAASAGGGAALHGGARGHFTLRPAGAPYDFSARGALSIVGHPAKEGTSKAAPQVFAIEPDSVIARNPNLTRVQYRTNTLRGSSGSPVLSAQWELVALHHYGRKDKYNQGIPTSAIAARERVRAAVGLA